MTYNRCMEEPTEEQLQQIMHEAYEDAMAEKRLRWKSCSKSTR